MNPVPVLVDFAVHVMAKTGILNSLMTGSATGYVKIYYIKLFRVLDDIQEIYIDIKYVQSHNLFMIYI